MQFDIPVVNFWKLFKNVNTQNKLTDIVYLHLTESHQACTN